MIRPGRQYKRIRVPETVCTVVRKHRGMVTYIQHGKKPVELTISVGAFKEIYRKVRKCRARK